VDTVSLGSPLRHCVILDHIHTVSADGSACRLLIGIVSARHAPETPRPVLLMVGDLALDQGIPVRPGYGSPRLFRWIPRRPDYESRLRKFDSFKRHASAHGELPESESGIRSPTLRAGTAGE